MSKKFPHNKPKGKHLPLSNPHVSDKHSKLTNVESENKKPSISLKYIDLRFCSFHDLRDNHNLKHFDAFLTKFNKTSNWETVSNDFQKAASDDPDSIQKMKSMGFDPKETEMFHLRVTQTFRVHGFYYEGRFKLVWLDPNHEIHKE